MSKKKKEILFVDKKDNSINFLEVPVKEKIEWVFSLKLGMLNTLIAFISTLFIVLLLNLLYLGAFLFYFWELIFLEGVLFYFASALVIWFGPSPQWRMVKQSILKKDVIVKTTTESIQVGASRFVTGTLLIVIVLIL